MDLRPQASLPDPLNSDTLWLLLAGVGAGLTGSVAGLASVVSFPALLAVGLPPVTANVTNTVALFGVTGGTIAGSQRELRGQGPRIVRLLSVSVAGGAAGAALLLLTPEEAFDLVVPWLVGLGSVLLLSRDRMRTWVNARAVRQPPRAGARRTLAWGLVVFALGIYAGYFGAGVGVLALAALALERTEALAVTNAVKNVVTGVANGTAAIAYILFAPVHWPSAIALGLGAVLGGLVGPMVVRAAPEPLFRWLVGSAGLALAIWLGVR